MSSTNIRDDELIQMAAFKLADTARRVAMLAKEAATPGLRRLLSASSAAITQQAQALRVDARKLEREALTPSQTQPRARVTARGRASGQRLTLADARAPRLAARG